MRCFDRRAEPWEDWIMQFESILDANGISEGKMKTSLLIGSLKVKAVEDLRTVCLPKTRGKKLFKIGLKS